MSYILDALRRAEAERERERGAVPSLHSPGLALGAEPPTSVRPAAPPPAWRLALVGGALGLLGVVLGLWWAGGGAPGAEQPPATPAAALAAAQSVQEAGQPSMLQAAPGPTAATPLRLPTPPVPPVLDRPPASPAAAEPALAASPAPEPAPVAPDAADQPAPAATAPAVTAEAPSAAAPPPPVIPLAALPAELRAAWPPLVIGGSIYSDNPASRFIMANGQVVREGQTAAPGVVVERIGRGAVVLQWRGLRVQVPV